MKFALSARQSEPFLSEADEIIINYIDKNILFDFIDKYSQKKIILKVRNNEEIEWDFIKGFKDCLNIVFCVSSIEHAHKCLNEGFSWYWAYPVDTFYELNGLLLNETSEIILGENLFYQLEKTYNICYNYNVKIRLIPNVAFDAYIPRANGIDGSFVRPEDVQFYEPYVETIEFDTGSLAEEHALFEIYKRGYWYGNLNLIITNLNYNIDNRLIPSNFGQNKLNCQHKCMSAYPCNLCKNIFRTISRIKEENIDE